MSNVPSNIPFTDINAGHTISEMVDIINTNFDLVNLKGGGPEGKQGIQGVFGFSGIQGIQGIQGRRGTGWVTQSNMGDAENGDLYLAPNGDVQSYNEEDGSWNTEYQLLDNVISPFTLTGTTIHPVDPTNKMVLGGSSSVTNSTLNVVGSNTAISITNGGTTANLKVDGYDFVMESDKISLKTSNTTLTLYGDNSILLSPLVDLTNDNTIHPFITVNSSGELTHQSNWEWGIVNESVVPNNTLNNCYIGDETHLLDGLWMDENSNINFKSNTNTSYLKINSKVPGEDLKNVVKICKNGVCVGSYSNDQNLNYNTVNSGIYVAGGSNQTCGQITFVGASVGRNTEYVNFDKVEPIGTNANTPTYILNVNDTRKNNIKDNSPLITLKPNSTNFSANTLHIKGGSYTNGKGYDVLIDGGDSWGEWNQKERTGGDVYIAGGSNRNNSSNGNEIRGSLYNFGDVVIGLNPNNHPSLRAGSATYASTRGVSSDSANVKFYDICNFTAHGNKITLNSDANNKAVNGYTSDGKHPWINNVGKATLKFNGLNTLYTNNPVSLNYEDAFTYQMLSGVYSTSFMYYMENGTLLTQRGSSLYSLLNGSVYSKLATKNRTVFSNITTNWQKIGNIINCNTRVDFYYVCNDYGDVSILHPIQYRFMLHDTMFAYDNIVKNGILTNIELPINLYKNYKNILLRPSYIIGGGTAYTEKIQIGTNQALILSSDDKFLNNIPVDVNNNTSYLGVQYVKPFSSSNTDCITNKHDGSGILRESPRMQTTKNISRGYLFSDGIIFGSDVTYSLLTPTTNSIYIIPEYMSSVKIKVSNEDHYKRKFVPVSLPYTTLTLNYSYLLNTGFEETIHNDFIYADGTSPILVDVGEIGNQTLTQNQEFYQQMY